MATSKPYADEQNFMVGRGDDKIIKFQGRDNGSIAGTTAVFTAQVTPGTNDPPALSVTATIDTVGSPSTPGIYAVTLTKALLLALDPRVYYHSFKRTDVNAAALIAKGKMTVVADILNQL